MTPVFQGWATGGLWCLCLRGRKLQAERLREDTKPSVGHVEFKDSMGQPGDIQGSIGHQPRSSEGCLNWRQKIRNPWHGGGI